MYNPDLEALCLRLQMQVVKSHGCICLTGPAVQHIAAAALSLVCDAGASPAKTCSPTSYDVANCHVGPSEALQQTALEPDSRSNDFRPHVTLVTKEELAACTVSRPDLLQDFQLLDSAAFFPAGIAVADMADVFYTHARAPSQPILQPGDDPKHARVRGQKSRVLTATSQLEARTDAHIDAFMEPSVGKSQRWICGQQHILVNLL